MRRKRARQSSAIAAHRTALNEGAPRRAAPAARDAAIRADDLAVVVWLGPVALRLAPGRRVAQSQPARTDCRAARLVMGRRLGIAVQDRAGRRHLLHGQARTLPWSVRLGAAPARRNSDRTQRDAWRGRADGRTPEQSAAPVARHRTGRHTQAGDEWRSGFWHIAHRAQVPILPVYFDYPSKTIGIRPLFEPGDDMPADIAALRSFYKPFRGMHRGI